jgi:hypothetical protein
MVNAQKPHPSTLPPSHPYDGVPMTILSGVGRSGTTIVRQALSRHPDLDSTNLENNILNELMNVAWRNCNEPDRVHAMRVDAKVYDAHFRALILRLLWPRPRLDSTRPDRLLAFTNLTPTSADYLVRLFPRVRVVYIVRNGIEVVSSRMRFEPFRHRDVASHSDTWALAYEMAKWGAGKREFQIVRHEWLKNTDGPERMMGTILSFLGLRAHAPCVEAFREELVHPTGDERALRGEDPASMIESKSAIGPETVAAGLRLPAERLRGRSERWRDWTDAERLAFESRCGEAMRSLGYDIPWTAAEAA